MICSPLARWLGEQGPPDQKRYLMTEVECVRQQLERSSVEGLCHLHRHGTELERIFSWGLLLNRLAQPDEL